MIYGVVVNGDRVRVEMTFTSAGCPAIDMLLADVRDAVGGLPQVGDVTVDVVWNPPWTKDRISERGRKVLAMYGVVS
jgi:metal-sulfur cluster biosynthetic enzyme